MPKFIINRSKDDKCFFTLVSANNKVVATSETYNSKQACYKGIRSVIAIASKAEIVDKSSKYGD